MPTSTVPNDKDAGESAICPKLVPFPESDMPTVASDALDVTVTVPLLLPLTVGVNVTVNAALWPAARVIGTVKGVRLNPLPVTAAWEIATLEPPEFVRLTVSTWLFPMRVLPKFKPVVLGERYPGDVVTPESENVVVPLLCLHLFPSYSVTTDRAPFAVPAT